MAWEAGVNFVPYTINSHILLEKMQKIAYNQTQTGRLFLLIFYQSMGVVKNVCKY